MYQNINLKKQFLWSRGKKRKPVMNFFNSNRRLMFPSIQHKYLPEIDFTYQWLQADHKVDVVGFHVIIFNVDI